MVYFIRAKSYFKYAQDLFSSLKESFEELPEEEVSKKAGEVAFIALKALWALSQVTPPEKPPNFEEVFKVALASFSEEKASLLKKLTSTINQRKGKFLILTSLEQLLALIKEELSPIL